MTTTLRAALLIVSETASKDASTDKCIPTLQDVFAAAATESTKWDTAKTEIVPDDALAIQRSIQSWSDTDDYYSLIVTSGGTGFTGKDITPEAVSPLLHKHAPGLVHGMLSASLQVTPFAMMARPVAGVRNKTLILTLPGSPKGAKENLEAVIKLLPHACQQAAGADSRTLHAGGTKQLEKQAGISSAPAPASTGHSHDHGHHNHHHGHGHGHGHGHHAPKPRSDPSTRPQPNDPSAPAAARHRTSPYPMLPVPEALSLISTHTPPPITTTVPLTTSIIGSVLAAPVKAAESVPAFRASIVDGYAVRLPCPAGSYTVSAISHAQLSSSDETEAELQPGNVARITTGAPLPLGAEAVVMVEDTKLTRTTEDGKEEVEVEILAGFKESDRGENVREVGSDVAAGAVVLEKGDAISASGGEYALLASVGMKEVSVYRRPVVGVLSTGDEVVPHDREGGLRRGEVRDTNRPSLLAAARALGYEAVDLGIARDTPGGLEEKLREGLGKVDVLVTTGGVSMGELDLLKPTVERKLGGTLHFGRVSMKPGKPSTFATVEAKDTRTAGDGVAAGEAGERRQKLVFGLPGNPASAVVTFHLFVLPALQKMNGVEPATGLPKVMVRIGERVRCDSKRQEYVRVVVAATAKGLLARSTGGQRSSRIGSFKGANGLVIMPVREGWVEEGDELEALMMGPLISQL